MAQDSYPPRASGGTSDHGGLTGLGDDDHSQYHNDDRHDSHDHSTALGTATAADLPSVAAGNIAATDVQAALEELDTEKEPAQVEKGFRAYLSTAQTLSASTFTKIVFDTEVRDQGADYDPTTGEWTAPATGWFDLAGASSFAGLSDGDRVALSVYVNGSPHTQVVSRSAGASGSQQFAWGLPFYFALGDLVAIYGYRVASGDVSAGNDLTYFIAKRRYVA